MIAAALVDAAGVAAGASAARVPWWSVTKPLIAAAALRLAETGRLDLDARLPGRGFTLAQALRHRAGLADYAALPEYRAAVAAGEAAWSDADLFARLGPPPFAPGKGWRYSNPGYLLARRAIEAVCCGDLGSALAELVLEPLGLSARLARQRGEVPGLRDYDPGWVFHGLVVGSVAEAALALHGILAGGLLKPASLAEMRRWHAIGGALPGRPWLTCGYGLGLMVGTMRGPRMRAPLYLEGHGASGPGSVGAVYHDPARGRTAAVFLPGVDEGAAEAEVLRLLLSP